MTKRTLQLRSVSYTPLLNDREFIQWCIRQIIFSRTKTIIPVFVNPGNDYAVDFYCTDELYGSVEKEVKELMPQLMRTLKIAVTDFFFVRGKYVENNVRMIDPQFCLQPQIEFLNQKINSQ